MTDEHVLSLMNIYTCVIQWANATNEYYTEYYLYFVFIWIAPNSIYNAYDVFEKYPNPAWKGISQPTCTHSPPEHQHNTRRTMT